MDDLKLIREKYGEKMMHLCRTLFPTLLETPGLLYDILSSHFDFNKFLYDDIVENYREVEFKNYIYSFLDVERMRTFTEMTPEELLQTAGYKLYECKTEDDIQKFKKYYAPGEELCTFIGGRLRRCYVFFAVKDNVDTIKRENFKNPKREDEYGTSVISIQFTRERPNTVSIKNRYNHVVNNPDATFQNNLDNIAPGLTESFEREYNLKIDRRNETNFELPNYVMANDGKLYKYNYEINNVYYCPNNIIIDNFEVKRDYTAKERYILADYFIIDMAAKRITIYDEKIKDSFVNQFKSIIKIEIEKNKENGSKIINIITSDFGIVKIELDKLNRIIGYSNEKIEKIEDSFLRYNKTLETFYVPEVRIIGDCFLINNDAMKKLYLPNVKEIGYDFMFNNNTLEEFVAPKLEYVEDSFLYDNKELRELSLPQLLRAGSNFIPQNRVLSELSLPSLEIIYDNFLFSNKALKVVELPNLSYIGESFMYDNEYLELLDAPLLEEVSHDFLGSNVNVEKLNLPSLFSVGMNFMSNNKAVDNVNMPLVRGLDNLIPYHIYELAVENWRDR